MSKAAERLRELADECEQDIHGAYDHDAALLRAVADVMEQAGQLFDKESDTDYANDVHNAADIAEQTAAGGE